MGILGLVSFIGLVVLGLWRFWKNPYLWFIAPLFALLVHGLIDTPYFKNDLSLIFWFLIGIAAISQKSSYGLTVKGLPAGKAGITSSTDSAGFGGRNRIISNKIKELRRKK